MSLDLSGTCSLTQTGVTLFELRWTLLYPEYEVRAIQTVRTAAYQQWLYAQGRSLPGRIVTQADGVIVLSNHQVQMKHWELAGHAVDLGLFKAGVYVTDDGPYEPFRALAEEIGLNSGWTFKHIDPDHLDCGRA